MNRSRPAPRDRARRRSLGAAVAFVDATIVNIAFPNIERSFPGTSISSLSWVLNAYNIVFAAFLVAAGRIADLLGRRRVFVFGLELFMFASLLCAIAPSPGALIVFRVVQALGAACLVPSSLALVLRRSRPTAARTGSPCCPPSAAAPPGSARRSAACWSPPTTGGSCSWSTSRSGSPRSCSRGACSSRAATPGRRRMPDLLGALLFAVAIAALVLGVVKGQSWGWGSARGSSLRSRSRSSLGGVFVWRCSWHRSPIIDLSLLRIRTFAPPTR